MLTEGFMTANRDVGVQSCACKGIRRCALCKDSERVKKLGADDKDLYKEFKSFVYSVSLGKPVHDPQLPSNPNLEDIHRSAEHINSLSDDTSGEDSLLVGGLHVIPNFIAESEEQELLQSIDKNDWALSQSGRRKQDYGPRVNFKHKKVKTDRFIGMPSYTDFILSRMTTISEQLFGCYQPFELCNLEYDGSRSSAIEMHHDDCWIWGNRLISLNLLSNAVLTFANGQKKLIVYVPLKRRTMVCMCDEVRYEWKHAVLSEHINGRRIALTMREPSDAFREGGELYEKFGRELIRLGNIRIQN